MEIIVGMCRYLLPFLALIILFKCFQTLLIGHPVNKTYGYIINKANGEKVALNTWETSIGRSKSCDISIFFPSVSRFHAVICRRVDGWYLFDTVSKTGTFLNGKKIESGVMIKNGDDIAFGDMHFIFTVIDDPVIKVGKRKKNGNSRTEPNTLDYDIDDIEKYYDLDSGTVKRKTQSDKSYTAQKRPAAKKRTAALLNQSTREKFILCSQRITVGRGMGNDLRLKSQAVSRNHAVLIYQGGRWYVSDAGSTHGTLVNGKQIKGNTPLGNGDVLTLGDERLKFVYDNR